MNDKTCVFKQALEILDSLLIPVFVAFAISPANIAPYLNNWAWPSWVSGTVLLGLIPLRIVFLAGVFGILAEIVSTEEKTAQPERFMKNCTDFWLIYLLISAVPYALHFLLFAFFPSSLIPVSAVVAVLNVPLLYILADWIITRKYLRYPKINPVQHILGPREAAVAIALIAGNVVLWRFSEAMPIGRFDLSAFGLFFYEYFQFLIFLYFAGLILRAHPQVRERFQNAKELVLITPSGGGLFPAYFSSVSRSYPPVFVILKALTPPEYKVRTYLNRVWRRRYYEGGKLVAITCFSSNSAEAYKIAKEFRKRGSKVVMGGPHASYMADEALEFCDSVVMGDADSVWEDIVRDYEQGCLKKKYRGTATDKNHDKIHQALLKSPPAVIKEFLETSHGCKFRCHFCTIPGLSGGGVTTKPVFEIVELIEKIRHRYRRIHFIDNNIYNNPAYTKDLFKALIPLKIKWVTFATLDIAKNDEILNLAKESGCENLAIGYDQVVGDSDDPKDGKMNMRANYLKYTKKIKKAGISIRANYIFGWEKDTFANLPKLWNFCFQLRPYITSLTMLTPFPGTKFYDDIIKENRIINLNWAKYTAQRLVFEPKQMDSRILAVLYPILPYFFLGTTCTLGNLLLGALLISQLYKLAL